MGQCDCVESVTGLLCNECAAGFFNDSGSCVPCNCNQTGTVDGNVSCELETGQCNCLPTVTGIQCDECELGFFNLTESNSGCTPCNCTVFGTVNNNVTCDSMGQCDCVKSVTGIQCDECELGFFNLTESNSGCTPCNCNILGTVNNNVTCDSTGQCDCVESVTGLLCNECAAGFFNDSGSCVPCNCNQTGTVDGNVSCELETGQCNCLPTVTGIQCDECDLGFFNLTESNRGCTPCNCTVFGTVNNNIACDSTGQCDCVESVTGIQCDECELGFFNLTESNSGCIPCNCNFFGTVNNSVTCDLTGQCDCVESITGLRCNECAAGFYNDSGSCVPCNCNQTGTVDGNVSCEVETGQCNCLPTVTGFQCDECELGFFNLTEINSGCTPCNCNVSGTVNNNVSCDSTGQCDCVESVTGIQCDECELGFFNLTESNSGCTPCNCNIFGTVNSNVSCNSTGQCDCVEPFTGLRCNECAAGFFNDSGSCVPCNCNQTGTVNGNVSCELETGQCNCLPTVTGIQCDECELGFFNLTESNSGCTPCNCNVFGTVNSNVTCDSTGQCNCLESVTGRSCDTCKAKYYTLGTVNSCNPCNCNIMGTVGGSATCNQTGHCDCEANMHVQGLRCNECETGFYYDSGLCVPCNCNQTGTVNGSEECQAVTGQCNCLSSVRGRQCDDCEYGFYNIDSETGSGCTPCNCNPYGSFSSNCDQDGKCSCKTNVEGLKCNKCMSLTYGITFSSGCEECDCDPAGTESCDTNYGTCYCRPNVTGSRCDQCLTGFYGIESNSGCVPCSDQVYNTTSECRDLIEIVCPATFESTPSTTTAAPCSVRIGDECQYCFCETINSACVTKSNDIRVCECQANYIQINDTVCETGPEVISQKRELTFTVSRDNITQVDIPYDGLGLLVGFLNVTADIIPTSESIVLTSSTDKLTIELTTPFETSSSFAVVLSASNSDGFSVQQVISVHFNLTTNDQIEHIQLLLVSGARNETLLTDIRSLDFLSREHDFTFELQPNLEDSDTLFGVERKTGRVLCMRDIKLDDGSVAKDYSFNITARSDQLADQTVATVDVLVLKDVFMASVDEGFVGEFLKVELRSENFNISLADPQTNVKLTNGSLWMISPRSYNENSRQIHLTLAVTSNDGSVQTAIEGLVSIRDTNDKAPFFHENNTEVYIIGGSSSGSIIAKVNATDEDTVGDVIYTLSGKYADDFEVDSSGVVTALDNLRREKFGNVFTLFVSANDGKRESSNTATIRVNLYPVPSNIDKDLNKTIVVNVIEHKEVGSFVYDISTEAANYSDYKFLNPSTNTPFSLNSTTGVLTISRDIDREETRQIWRDNVDIGAFEDFSDGCEPVRIGKLQVNIIDINDNSPHFSKSAYNGTIAEHSPINSFVSDLMELHAADADTGPNARLSFHISDTEHFSVFQEDDRIELRIKKELDREKIANYAVNITAVDNPIKQEERRSDTTMVYIRVTDINDNAPDFGNPNSTVNIVENEAPTDLASFRAEDKDEGSNADIIYNINSGGFGYFKIDQNGMLSTTGAVDRELYQRFDLIIRATDKGSPHKATNLNVTVYVNDKNDNAPKFERDFQLFEVAEDQDCLKLNLMITAVDPDNGLNGTISYYLDNSKFSINKTTGVLACKSALDYEEDTEYEFTVTASDNAEDRKNSTVMIKIIVKDINDNRPIFSKPIGRKKVDKTDLKNNTFILAVEVRDADSGKNGEINLTLSGEHKVNFTISQGNTGVLQPSGAVPGIGKYRLNITATDQGSPPLSNTTTVEFEIVENDPTDTRNEWINIMVPEHNCSGSTLATVSVEAYGNQALFNLTRSVFDIFNLDHTSGSISCRGELDREKRNSYLLVVNVSKQDNSESQSVLVIVTVTDVNDNDPEFPSKEILTNSVPEDALNGTFIQRITATDVDEGLNGDIGLRYAIITPEIPFTIDELNGTLTTQGGLDRETVDSYMINIMVSDSGNPQRSSTASVSIYLTDINDNAPMFSSDHYYMEVYENMTVGTDFDNTSIWASDTDYSTNGTVDFRSDIHEKGNVSVPCPFILKVEQVKSDTAVVNLQDNLDFETRRNYTCIIYAFDAIGKDDYHLESNSTITVKVLDNNDQTPEFQGLPYVTNVSRDAEIDFNITDIVSATDDDTDDGNNNVSFSLVNDMNFFKIDSATGVLSVIKKLDTLQKDFVSLQVVARDNPKTDPPLSATTTIDIEIIDTNPRPWFPNSPFTGIITEERVNTNLLVNMSALDQIDGRNVTCNCTYRIIPSNFSDAFSISTDGLLTQKDEIDREETGDSLLLEVNVTDFGKPRKIAQARLELQVVDINDNIPKFQNKTYSFSRTEPVHVGHIIGMLQAVDEDTGENAVYIYSAVGIDDRLSLLENGTITVKKTLSTKNETVEIIKFDARVSDSKDTENTVLRTSDITVTAVTITVNPADNNKHTPTFEQETYQTKLPFLSKKGTKIKLENFKATDGDGEEITYRIAAGNKREIIDINSLSGEMSIRYDLDESIGQFINLTVEAVDNNARPKTGSCTVFVTLTNLEATACVSERQLQVDSQQREMFLGLFVAMAILLAVAFVTTIYTCYKWRSTKSLTDRYKTMNKDGVTHYERNKSISGFSENRQYLGLDVTKMTNRGESNRSELYKDFSSGSVHNPAYVSAGKPNRRPCLPPAEPPVDYDDDRDVEIPRHRRTDNILSRTVPLSPHYLAGQYRPTSSVKMF